MEKAFVKQKVEKPARMSEVNRQQSKGQRWG
jgi:hypothetical protein